MTAEWNHNIHLHRIVLDAMPQPCPAALDVGCGDGMLTTELAGRAGRVAAIDVDAASVERARARVERGGLDNVELTVADVLDHTFEPGSFDLVAGIAVLHHLPFEPALRRLAELVRPGGVLALVGLARTRSPLDLAYDVGGAVSTRVHKRLLGKTYWEHSAPIREPTMSYGQVRAGAERILPGMRYRRHLLWRYSIVWTRPATTSA